MTTKTRVTLLIGFVVFVGGTAGAAYLGTRGSGGPTASDSGVEVLYAARPVPAGTAGSNAMAEGLVKTRTVAPRARPAGAMTDPSQLSGRVAASAIREGTIITGDLFAAPQTRIGTLHIPPGKRVLAVELEHVRGVAGYVGAGDRVDVYGVSTGDHGNVPGVQLVLQAVEVLSVNGTGLPSAQGQPGGPGLVYLLAVTPTEAERLIYLEEFERMYFDLVADGEPPVATPGAGPDQALQAL